MTIVALTGGIAAGKSTVSDRLAEHGIIVIDADQVARDVVEPGSDTLASIIGYFGPQVSRADGSLNRDALGKIVFSDQDARNALNAIVHPAVRTRSKELFDQAHKDHPDTVVVYAVPLVAEARGREEFDCIVVVHAPRHQRIARLVEFRGMTEADATARVDAQATDEERLAIADVVVDASGEPADTLHAADLLAQSLIAHWPDDLATMPKRFPGKES
jgi:dephospho-CoA kinase